MPLKQREELSKALKGREIDAAWRAKLSRPRPNAQGIPKTEEHRNKIAQALRGRVFSKETITKMREAKRGWFPSEEMRRIQSEKCSGEGNGRSKLTEGQVIEIRERYAKGDMSLTKLAKGYPVGFGTIYRIVTKGIWKHI